jgi:hypothetical protein
MTYSPSLVTEDELRNAFDPALSTTDLSQARALTIIELIESYIRDTYFDGTMPTATVGKMPALALSMSKVINGNAILSKAHKPVSSFTIDNYSVRYEDGTSALEYSLEAYAHRVLMQQDMKARSHIIVKAND